MNGTHREQKLSVDKLEPVVDTVPLVHEQAPFKTAQPAPSYLSKLAQKKDLSKTDDFNERAQPQK